MISKPLHVTDETFEKEVLQSTLPVIVDFWAPWCVPCKMLAPLLDEAANCYAGKLVIAKVDADENTEHTGHYGIQTIPTLIFIKNGYSFKTHSGSISRAELFEMIDEFLAI